MQLMYYISQMSTPVFQKLEDYHIERVGNYKPINDHIQKHIC